jgi:hypothetical protein
MIRLLIVATAVTFVAATFAEAAPRKRSVAVITKQVNLTTFPGRPAWAKPDDCFTDDGYGRFWPCSAGCRG